MMRRRRINYILPLTDYNSSCFIYVNFQLEYFFPTIGPHKHLISSSDLLAATCLSTQPRNKFMEVAPLGFY
jgi:hypothetical protein